MAVASWWEGLSTDFYQIFGWLLIGTVLAESVRLIRAGSPRISPPRYLRRIPSGMYSILYYTVGLGALMMGIGFLTRAFILADLGTVLGLVALIWIHILGALARGRAEREEWKDEW